MTGDELAFADRQIVVDGDRTFFDELVGQMTADESGASHDEGTHPRGIADTPPHINHRNDAKIRPRSARFARHAQGGVLVVTGPPVRSHRAGAALFLRAPGAYARTMG